MTQRILMHPLTGRTLVKGVRSLLNELPSELMTELDRFIMEPEWWPIRRELMRDIKIARYPAAFQTFCGAGARGPNAVTFRFIHRNQGLLVPPSPVSPSMVGANNVPQWNPLQEAGANNVPQWYTTWLYFDPHSVKERQTALRIYLSCRRVPDPKVVAALPVVPPRM